MFWHNIAVKTASTAAITEVSAATLDHSLHDTTDKMVLICAVLNFQQGNCTLATLLYRPQ